MLKLAKYALVATLAVAIATPASAEGWLLRRFPAVAAAAAAVTAVSAAHAIRDTMGQAISGYGSAQSTSIIQDLRDRLNHHRIVGPRAAIDTAARIVKAHPELRSNTVAVLQVLELPLIAFEARLAQTRPGEAVAAQVDEREDESNCPPSTPANEAMSARAAAYQKQITGLDPGLVVVLNNVKFDGCRQSDGTMLEAKGPGYAQFIVASAGEVQSWYQGEISILDQAERQAEAALADNRKLEWHFAEKLASEYYARKFRASAYARTIIVMYDPPL